MKTRSPETSPTQSLTLPTPEAFRRATIATSAPEPVAGEVADDQTPALAPIEASEDAESEIQISATTDRRFTIIDLNWKVKDVSVRNDLVAESPLGRFVISTRFLTGGPICDLVLPQIGSNPARKIPCESIEEARSLAREEIALVVQQLIVEREDINVV